MTLELIAFIISILFGILLYWRESNGNRIYRFLNKLMNAKGLQMKPTDRTGFVYQQKFLLRLVFITFLFIVVMLVLKFLIPINYATISMFASAIVGTLIGTYLANFVFKSSEIIDEKSESIEDIVHTTLDKGKDFIGDIAHKEDTAKEINEKAEIPKVEEKSARERLKDKGLL
ncbi:MAG TPA: hypothetical protein ENK46_10985 [Flavobacteriia bacterium]|nr:hypothetical protein [Flavobacteriia bacterium]